MSYDKNPRAYWEARFLRQGPTYVASSEAEYTSQAQAFWRHIRWALGPMPGRVLDFGCGTGRFAPLYLRLDSGVNYVGVDLNRLAIDALQREYAENPRAEFYGEISEIPGDDRVFDAVVACTVLQHVPGCLISMVCNSIVNTVETPVIVLIEDNNPEGHRPAAHMAFRSPEDYQDLLRRSLIDHRVISAERPKSHWIGVYE